MTENFEFRTETKKLLNIIINSLYKNKDIFMRELISNASDALNKVRLKQLTSEDVYQKEVDLAINILVDKENKTITIKDTGIGMTREELIENLGTIAQSGTENFVKALEDEEEQKDLIGQFGVGFYSAFLVASKVEVLSRSYQPNSKANKWISEGLETFEIEEAEMDDRGTQITLHLKDDDDELESYLEDFKIKEIVKAYSNYVEFPIRLGEEEDPINEMTALWRVNPDEVEEEKYKEFYQHLGQFGEPMHTIHVKVDTPYQFHAILYIPRTKSRMFGMDDKDWGLKLYNRKILIDENNKDVLPEYLRFVIGVVDAEDFDLNVSREVVQTTRVQRQMQNYLHKKVVTELEKMAKKDEDKYMDFYREFGSFLKEGIAANTKHKDKLIDLLRFHTNKKEGKLGDVSLAQYVERMKPDQEEIYYLSGLDLEVLKKSPHLEYYNEEDLEVLLMGDAIDSFLMMHLHDYNDKKLFLIDQDETPDEPEVSKEDTEEDEEEEDKPKEKTGPLAPLLNKAMEMLEGKVADVKTSDRLVGSVARLVTSKGGISSDLQRAMKIMESQTGSAPMNFGMTGKVLQLNPKHDLIQKLNTLIENNPDNEMIEMMIFQIHDNARIADGDVVDFNKIINRTEKLMIKALE